MRKLAVAIGIALVTTGAWAMCSTHTYTINGRMVTCTTCCYGSNCSTNCF